MKLATLKGLLLAASLGCMTDAMAGATLVQDVRVFDGKAVHERRSVLLVDGVIADADFHGKAPAGARVVNGTGRTLLPGLIDSHVHAFTHFELPLVFGVTTQVDMFTGVSVVQRVSKAMAEGRNHDQADLFSAGTLVTAPGGHGTEFGMPIPTLDKAEDAQAFVDARIAEGSYFIKVVMEEGFGNTSFKSLDKATVKAVIDAAHRRGKLVVVHISTLADARAALDMGADGLAHLFLGKAITAQEAADLAQLASTKGAFVIPTFSVLESMAGVKPRDILDDPAVAGLLDKAERTTLQFGYTPVPIPALMTAPKATVAALRKAGVPLLAGTDAGNQGTQFGASLHHELAALVDAGLTPREALAAATSVPAKAFHLGRRGEVASGYKADLVLVEGNPLADIRATRHIVEVWKDGESAAAQRERQRAHVAQDQSAPRGQPVTLPADGRISLLREGQLASPFGQGWQTVGDSMIGGHSTAALTVQPAEAGNGAVAVVDAQIKPGFGYPWAGLTFIPGSPSNAADLSAVKQIRFRVRGDGQRYQVVMSSRGMQIPRSVPFEAGAQWKEVTVPVGAFADVDLSAVSMIGFNAGPQLGRYHVEIADVRLDDH